MQDFYFDDRMRGVCCLEYGVPYLPANGFALMSVAHRNKSKLLEAILSIQVLNAATPVLVAIIGYGWTLYLLERRVNQRQFHSQAASVCAYRRRTDACLMHAPPHAVTLTHARAARRLCVCLNRNIRLRRCVGQVWALEAHLT